ncbi:MAG TPA: hypothetical protein PK703_03660, partial [Gemmiger qucibialis]|nr:hypothetical protein [Gemmiger qucibialis]
VSAPFVKHFFEFFQKVFFPLLRRQCCGTNSAAIGFAGISWQPFPVLFRFLFLHYTTIAQ